jgi:hypothetical protein
MVWAPRLYLLYWLVVHKRHFKGAAVVVTTGRNFKRKITNSQVLVAFSSLSVVVVYLGIPHRVRVLRATTAQNAPNHRAEIVFPVRYTTGGRSLPSACAQAVMMFDAQAVL